MPTLWNHAPDGYGDLSNKLSVWLLPARALALSTPADSVQLHPTLEAEHPHILSHYRRIGLACTAHAEYGLGYGTIHRYPSHDHGVWLFGPEANAVRPDSQRFEATRFLNDKNQFINWFRDTLGLPTPITECYKHGQSVANTKLTLPLFVKGAVSGAGMEVFYCEAWPEVETAISSIPGDYQLQKPVEHIESLNVQYYADNTGQTTHLATSKQLLEKGTIHQGNCFPTRFDPRPITDPAARAASRLGVRGVFAFDVLVETTRQFKFLECNPRPNGATYFTVTGKRLGIAAWTGVNVQTRYRSLADIKLGPLEFNPTTKTGLVIVSWGTIRLGYLGILAAGTAGQQTTLLEQFSRRFA